MKHCIKCGINKPFTDFGKHAKHGKSGLQSYCKDCRNQQRREWYSHNQEIQIQRVMNVKIKRRALARELIIEYLNTHPCVDCGYSDVRVLEFDHRNPNDKFLGVGKMVSNGYSTDKILAEIKKCDIRCCNCHRIRTGQQFNWYRELLSE